MRKITAIVLHVNVDAVLVDFEQRERDKLWARADGFEIYLRRNNCDISKRYNQIYHAACVAVQSCGGHCGTLRLVKEKPKKKSSKAFQAMVENSKRLI